ncbi:MAG: T9SS type A sorting domain-containing protein [Bacteroidota bacterium]
MKKSTVLHIIVATAGFALGLASVVDTAHHQSRAQWGTFSIKPAEEEQAPSSIGVGENPNARELYEWTRLHDPRSGTIPPGIREKELAFSARLPKKVSSAMAKSSGTQVFSWSPRGPYNVGGRTRALAVDVSNTNRILAGGVSGGMWLSADAGANWSRTTSLSEVIQSVTAVAQDTRGGHTATWYYGTGELSGNSAFGGGNSSYRGDGMFKSTNGGGTWSKLAATATNSPQTFDPPWDYIWNVAIDPSNASQEEVYAATVAAIMRSSDGGASWTLVRGNTSSGPRYTDVVVTSTGVVYAAMSAIDFNLATYSATDKGIWRSTDGVSWTNITPAGFPSQYSRIVLGVAPSDQNTVYFVVQGTNGTNGTDQINSHQFWKYTYVSGDGSGANGTWANRGVNLPNESGVSGNAVFDTQSGYDMIVRVKPDDPNFVIVGSTNLYRSTDGFATNANWKRIGGYAGPANYSLYTTHHPDQHSGLFKPGSNVIYYSGHDGGVTVTNDVTATTVAWSTLNNGYTTGQFYTVALDHGSNGDMTVIGGLQDNGTWQAATDIPTSAWSSLLGGDGAYCAISDGGVAAYVSAQNGQIYELTSTGFVRVDPTGGNYGTLFIVPFALDPNNSVIMYLNGDKIIWRNKNLFGITVDNTSTTKTTNWDSLSTVRGTGSVTALAVSKTPSNILYYGTSSGSVYRMLNANTGLPTPVDIGSGKGLPAAYVSSIALDPTNADNALVVFSNYGVQSLFSTTNGGTSWTNVSGNLEQNADGSGNGPSCRWAVVHRGGTGVVYFVGTSVGLYSTSVLNGSSTSWAQEGPGTIGNVVVDMIDNRNSDGTVVVGTHGNGVFSSTVLTSVERVANGIPSHFDLGQNYPNPFNPTTRIRYTIPEPGNVRLRVFDIRGNEVTTLVDESQSAGVYEAFWNGADRSGIPVSSGTYFYRLESGNRTSTQKMLLLK